MNLLYLVRHGESKANAAGIYQGQTYDTPLTELGRIQAQRVGEALADVPIEAVYTSPLKRTLQTAKAIAKEIKKPIIQDRLLLEINHGTWEGKRVTHFSEKELEVLEQWRIQPDKTQMIEGEHFADVLLRCHRFLHQLPKTDKGYVLVTHDVVIRIMIALFFKLPLNQIWNFQLDNCGITQISLDSEKVISVNQNHHLQNYQATIALQAL